MRVWDYFDQEFLGRTVLGATVFQWLLLVLLSALFVFGLRMLHRFLVWRISRFAEKTSNRVDNYVAELLKSTRSYFLVALGFYLSLLLLDMPEVVVVWIGRITFVLLMLQVIRWGGRVISLWINGYRERKLEVDASAVTTMQAVGVLSRVLLIIVVVLFTLSNFGVEITPLVASLGIGGIAVALAVQNVLGDLFASLSIVLDKPFVVGDFLIIDQYQGSVEYIGLKTTRLRSLSGEQIIFSNGDLLQSRIRNYKRMFERRIVFKIGVVYDTPLDKLESISGMLKEIVKSQDRVRFDRAHFQGLGDFALSYEVVYYVLDANYNLYMDIQQAINLEILRRFREGGIEFAYPTQTLLVEKVPSMSVSMSDGGSSDATRS